VTLTHHNILNNGYFTAAPCADRTGSHLHTGAAVSLLRHGMGNLAAVTLGATMVYPGEGFDPLATLQTIEKENARRSMGADHVHRPA
jgi:fatty-acyl-CoA synthase